MQIYRSEFAVEAYQPVEALPRPRGRRRVAIGREWLGEHVTTTPGRLAAICLLVLAVTACFGIAATAAEHTRARAAEAARARTEPRLLETVHLYGALSDANATVTATFTTGGLEPPARRARYVSDLETASSSLHALTQAIGDAPAARLSLATIAAQLPVYSGLIESARANNREGFPVGAAYMRQASSLLSGTMLPAAEQLFRLEALQLSDDYGHGTGAGVLAVLALAAALAFALLIATQVYLARISRRILNIPLLCATVVLVAVSVWTLVGAVGEQNALARSRTTGSDSVELLSATSVLLSRAQGDQSLAVVNRGTDERDALDYDAVMRVLAPGRDGRHLIGAASALVGQTQTTDAARRLSRQFDAYRAASDRVSKLENRGLIGDAITQAPRATARGEELDRTVTGYLATAQSRFEQAAADATSFLSGLGLAIPLMTVLAAALVLLGVAERISEYR
jgi:hypothetical protein